MNDYLDVLSTFVADTKIEDLSPETISAVKDVILDTIGAIVAGSREPENLKLAQFASSKSGPTTASIFGYQDKAEPMLATLANSASGVALEMDEGNRFGGGHPAIHCMPGAFAMAEEGGAHGKQIIESILVGYEVESRIGSATNPRPNVHSHGHWGTVGTAASVAKLRNYDAGKVRDIINLASSMSPANSWQPAFHGATIRNLYPGRSGLQGILAVHLYECGFTGIDDAPSDVFGTIIGDRFEPESAIENLGNPYRIEQNYFKFFACCRQNHSPLQAVLQAKSHNRFRPEEVESVNITTRHMLDGMFTHAYPESMLGAKFNAPFAVAAAIVRGAADVNSFRPNAINDERIKSLSSKVKVVVDPQLGAHQENGPFSTATIRLIDGQTFRGTCDLVDGDYGNRLPRQQLIDKFYSLNSEIMGSDRIDSVIKTVDRLETLSNIQDLTSLLTFNATT